jgi:hypothetical protein
MDIIQAINTFTSSAPTVESNGQTQNLILLCLLTYSVTTKHKVPIVTKRKREMVINAGTTMEEIIHKIQVENESTEKLIKILDLEVVSEHGYTSNPQVVKKEETTTFKLLDYQEDMVSKGVKIINERKLVIYALEMRLGKTHISLETAKRIGAKKVLFLTPKAAIPSIQEDYEAASHTFDITVTNYEQLKPRYEEFKDTNFDLIICDEFHKIGSSFPKPSNKAKMLRELGNTGVRFIFLSGTPTPESYSQIYHSLYITPNSPFSQYKNFYAWCKDYVNVYTIKIAGRDARQYNSAKEDEIMEKINPLFLSYSQQEAKFNHEVKDEIHTIPMSEKQANLLKLLKRDKVVRFKDGGKIVADTPAKLVNYIHQICSGTIKYEGENGEELRKTFEMSKIDYIEDKLIEPKSRTAIFYCFIEEGNALRERFPNSTSDVETFQKGDADTLISQVRTVREGVNIAGADSIIFYNIGFSYTDYAQARQRHQEKDRKSQPVARFIFVEGGIESQIYKRVKNKKSFTSRYYVG